MMMKQKLLEFLLQQRKTKVSYPAMKLFVCVCFFFVHLYFATYPLCSALLSIKDTSITVGPLLIKPTLI